MLEVMIKKMNKEEVTVCTSIDVSETFEKRHDHVLRDVENLKEDVPNFGDMFFEKTEKDTYGRDRKIYFMNRDGFTLLVMGYTGEKAMRFKLAYIKQFNHMEKLLKEKFVERQKGITVKHIVTDMIKQSNENERMHGHAYSLYTDMIYKALFGKTAKQFREEYGLSKTDSLRDFLTNEELRAVQSKEMLVTSLIDCGWGYSQIKDFVEQQTIKMIS